MAGTVVPWLFCCPFSSFSRSDLKEVWRIDGGWRSRSLTTPGFTSRPRRGSTARGRWVGPDPFHSFLFGEDERRKSLGALRTLRVSIERKRMSIPSGRKAGQWPMDDRMRHGISQAVRSRSGSVLVAPVRRTAHPLSSDVLQESFGHRKSSFASACSRQLGRAWRPARRGLFVDRISSPCG